MRQSRVCTAVFGLLCGLILAACGGGGATGSTGAVAGTSGTDTSQVVTGTLAGNTASTGATAGSNGSASSGTAMSGNPGSAGASGGYAGGTTVGGSSGASSATPAQTSASASSASAASAVNAATGTGEALISWLPPAENTDGTTLTDLTGFNVYFGKDPQKFDQIVTLDCHWCLWTRISDLGPGTWYFAVKSFNKSGIESAFSSVMSKTIR